MFVQCIVYVLFFLFITHLLYNTYNNSCTLITYNYIICYGFLIVSVNVLINTLPDSIDEVFFIIVGYISISHNLYIIFY